MTTILFALPGNESTARILAELLHAELGNAIIRSFPDGETYVRVLSDVQGKHVILVCTLHQPDAKVLPLYFLAQTIRQQGASHICLVAPYLAYMRQDKAFQTGEAITSRHFAALLANTADSLVTIDPHLHRFHHMHELYTIPAVAMHAAPVIANWLKHNLEKPLLVGPDEESMQWVKEVADLIGVPYLVLRKTRFSDTEVQISNPDMSQYFTHTPVLVDDIISTAHTMIETVKHLKSLTEKRPVCIGVHAVFASNAYHDLLDAGAAQVITCNTIAHASNGISTEALLAEGVEKLEIRN